MEAVTPQLVNLHPAAIVDALHYKCVNTVKAQNKLKQHQPSTQTVERRDGKDKTHASSKQVPDARPTSKENTSKTSRLQVMFSLSKVSGSDRNRL